MAERRMFAKTIVLSDAFLDMPITARCLYFTLGMEADDDGFVNSPKSIMRKIGSSIDDLNVLIAKKFVLAFEDGVIVVKHWRINNYLRNDRYKETVYLDDKEKITIDEQGIYHKAEEDVGIPNMGIPRLGKDSIGKDSIGKVNTISKHIGLEKPSVCDVEAYIHEKNYHFSAEDFVAYYESNGWKVGKNPMKDWKAACRTWESRYKQEHKSERTFGDIADEMEREWANGFERNKQNP